MIPITCAISALRNDKKCKYIFLFPKNNFSMTRFDIYGHVSNISRTLIDNKIVDHSDVVEASPVGAAPTTSSSST